VLFGKIASIYFILKYINILALEMARLGNRHFANCIGTLSFPIGRLHLTVLYKIQNLPDKNIFLNYTIFLENLGFYHGDAENARQEIAGHENAAPCCRDGKCET